MNSLIRFSSISCRPLEFLAASPLGRMYVSRSLKLALPASTRRPSSQSQLLVAFLDESGQPAVGHDRAGDLEPAGKGVHAADVGMEQVDRLEAFPAHLGVEVDAAGGEARPCRRMQSMHWVVR